MTKPGIVLIGAGGHARAVYALLLSCGYRVAEFYDDNFREGEKIGEAVASGTFSQIPDGSTVVLAIGESVKRAEFFKRYSGTVLRQNVFHDSCINFSPDALGESNLFFPGVKLGAFITIGNNNIFNTGCIIEHECKIGSHNHVSLAAVIAGRVTIGDHCFIGAGAVIKDGIVIGDHVTVGAGAVVTKDLPEPGIYAGVPAKRMI